MYASSGILASVSARRAPGTPITPTGLARDDIDLAVAERFHQAFFEVFEPTLSANRLCVLGGIVFGQRRRVLDQFSAWADLVDAEELLLLDGPDIERSLGLDSADIGSVLSTTDLVDAIRPRMTGDDGKLDVPLVIELLDRMRTALAGPPVAGRGRVPLRALGEHLAVEEWCARHIHDIGAFVGLPSLALHHDDARSGRQWAFDDGRRADLLCRTTAAHEPLPAGTWMVIETHGRPADRAAVRRLTDLMSLVWGELVGTDGAVAGCLVASDFDESAEDQLERNEFPIVACTVQDVAAEAQRRRAEAVRVTG